MWVKAPLPEPSQQFVGPQAALWPRAPWQAVKGIWDESGSGLWVCPLLQPIQECVQLRLQTKNYNLQYAWLKDLNLPFRSLTSSPNGEALYQWPPSEAPPLCSDEWSQVTGIYTHLAPSLKWVDWRLTGIKRCPVMDQWPVLCVLTQRYLRLDQPANMQSGTISLSNCM